MHIAAAIDVYKRQLFGFKYGPMVEFADDCVGHLDVVSGTPTKIQLAKIRLILEAPVEKLSFLFNM